MNNDPSSTPTPSSQTQGPRDGNSSLLTIVKAQIVFLLSTLTEDNFERNQNEIRSLSEQHGPETYLHFLRRLIVATQPRVQASNPSWDTSMLPFRLLVNEIQRLARDPILAERFREAVDKADTEPWRHFDLVRLIERVGLRPLERLILASSIMSVTVRRDLIQPAASIIRVDFENARQAILSHPSFESGDLSIQQAKRLLTSLLCEPSPDQPILDPTQRASLLTAACAKYGMDAMIPVLKAILPRISLIPGTSLTQALVQLGPELTTDPEVVRAFLARFGITDNNPPTDMQVLEMISKLARFAIEGQPLCDIGALTRALSSYKVPIHWDKAVRVLDRPERSGIDTATLKLIVAILINAPTEIQEHHAVAGFWQSWSNTLYQLRLIDKLLALPSDTFSFVHLPGRRVVTVEDVSTASPTIKALAANVQNSTWNSLDLFELLVRLGDHESLEVKAFVRELLDRAIRVSAELVHMGLLQVPKPWNALQREYADKALNMFLGGYPNHQLVFMRIWQIDPQYLLTAFRDHYNDNPINITRILDVAQDLKILDSLLEVQPFSFSLDVASLASRREYLNLDKWLADNTSQHGEVFIREMVEFVRVKIQHEHARMHDTAESRIMLLNAQTVACFIRAMRNFTSSPAGANLTAEDQEQMLEVRNICLQAHPRLMNLVPGNDQEAGLSVVTYPPEIEEQVEDIYRQLYGNQLTVEALLAILQDAKASGNARDSQIFAGVLHTVFDEYKFYPQYPPRELLITANLFGCLIQYQLVENIPLGIAIRYVLAAINEQYGSKVYSFGVQALSRFYPRLVEFPSVCHELLNISHFVEHEELAEQVRRALRIAESHAAGNGVVEKLQIFSAIQVDELGPEDGIVEPEEELSDKILFIVNNLAPNNFDSKTNEMKDRYDDRFARWFAQYLVVERVSTEPNNHGLYLRFLDALGRPILMRFILHETYSRSSELINDEATVGSQVDRQTLKNLASWLGSLTLARNRPVKHKNLSVKELLLEAYDHQRLLVVVPFVCKLLEAAQHSEVFQPPNPWLMAILSLLVEMYKYADLKIQVKFEIELLFRVFSLSLDQVDESTLLRSRPADHLPGAITNGFEEDPARQAAGGYIEQAVSNGGNANGLIAANEEAALAEYIENLIAEMRLGLHLDPDLDPWWKIPRFSAMVQDVFEQSTRDVIPPVVERSASVAAISAHSLVSRDYALEPDENNIQRAAALMVRKLATGLALVTAKDVLRTNLSNNIYHELMQPKFAELRFPEAYITKLIEPNLEFACLVVESVAAKRAMFEVNSMLEGEYEARRLHRMHHPGQPFVNTKNPLSEFAATLPMPLRLHPSGVTNEQNQIYAEFNRPTHDGRRRMPAHRGNRGQGKGPEPPIHQVTVERFPAVDPSPEPLGKPPHVSPHRRIIPYEQCCERIDAIFADFEACWSEPQGMDNLPTTEDLIEQTMMLIDATDYPERAQLHLCQKLVQALLSSRNDTPRQAYANYLRQLKLSGLGVATEAVDWFTHGNDPRMFSTPAVLSLVMADLIDLNAYEEELARKVLQEPSSDLIRYTVTFLKTCLYREPQLLPPDNFIRCFEALKVLELQGKASSDVSELMEQLRIEVHTIATSNARLPQNFHDLYPRLESLFLHWVSYFQNWSTDRDFLVYAVELENASVLKNDETCAMFFRVCIEVSVDRYISVLARSSTINPYLHVDALSRLLVLMIKYNSEENHDAAKAHILKKILSIITLVLSHQHEEFGAQFQQRPFFRFFSSLLSDLQSFEIGSATAYYPMLMNVCETLQGLQPIYFPGFVFSWMALISHRLFLPQMLITPNGEGWPAFQRLLVALINFIAPSLKTGAVPGSLRGIQQGVLRILLLLLHDFPEFLSANYFSLCEAIPPNCVQLRNIVLSAFPGTILLPDPHSSTVTEMWQEAASAPTIAGDYRVLLKAINLQVVEQVLRGHGDASLMTAIADRLVRAEPRESGDRYHTSVLNALVLYAGVVASAHLASRNDAVPFSPADPGVRLIQHLATVFDAEGRHALVSAVALNLRYPSQHTFWFSGLALHLFAEAKDSNLKEIVVRVLLERVLCHRPHPWGVVMTIVELIRDPKCNFFGQSFVQELPEVNAILHKIQGHLLESAEE